MLDNEPTGGSGASDTFTAGTTSDSTHTRTTKRVSPAPAVVFMAPEVPPAPPPSDEPAASGGGERSTKRRRSRKAESAGGKSQAGEKGQTGGESQTSGPDVAERPGNGDGPDEPVEQPTRRSRSRRKSRAESSDDTDGDRSETDQTPQASAESAPKPDAAGDAATDEDAASAPSGDSAGDSASAEGDEGSGTRRRRRRGRRGRGRGKGAEETPSEEPAAAAAPEPQAAAEESEPVEEVSPTRRRRRRRRKGAAAEVETVDEDGVPTVVKVREGRSAVDEVQGVEGSTRLEAKRQRRRDGREQRRTRPQILSEAEFLARRESVDRVMVIRSTGDRTQVGVLEDGVLVEHYVSTANNNSMAGNVYLGKVQNVLPSMEAAFIDIGRGRNAVLYAGEVNWDVTGLEGRTRTIEQALKPGDSVLVQVTKDPVGHKGARLTSHVTLSGRHLVYVPYGNASGISRKLPDTERKRLREVLKKLVPEGAGVIVRTAAEGATEADLERDIKRLQAQWEAIEQKAKTAKPPALLYEEPDLVIRVVRDLFNEDFRELVIQGDDAWNLVEPYLQHVSPDLVSRVRRHTGPNDLFAEMRVDEQLYKALDRKVYLPSGGHLVIDRTEAMTVIDVNTGKFTGKGGNLEETVTRNNLEAAEEIVHQLRLRDLGGIIVIDFIDMVLESNRELVLRRLTECLGRDRTKHQVTEITSLGLVQMTRKRVGQGLLEAFSETCEHCRGRGVIIDTSVLEPRPPKPSSAPKSTPALSAAAEVKRVAAAAANGRSSRPATSPANGEPADDAAGGKGAAADAATSAPKEESRAGRRRRKKAAKAAQNAAGGPADGGAQADANDATGVAEGEAGSAATSAGAASSEPDGGASDPVTGGAADQADKSSDDAPVAAEDASQRAVDRAAPALSAGVAQPVRKDAVSTPPAEPQPDEEPLAEPTRGAGAPV